LGHVVMDETLQKKHAGERHPIRRQHVVDGQLHPAETGAARGKPFYRRWLCLATAVVTITAAAWCVHYCPQAGKIKAAASNMTGNGEKVSLGFSNSNTPNNAPQNHIETIPVELIPRNDVLRLTGSLIADETSAVASNVSGIVEKVLVDRGSVVKKGDLLVQLDPTDAENKLAEGIALVEELEAKLSLKKDSPQPFTSEEQPQVKLVKASQELAASRFRRNDKLVAKGAVSVDDYEASKAECELTEQRYQQAMHEVRYIYQNYKTAVVRLAALRKAVSDTRILAPFDGIVAEKHVNVQEQIVGGFVASKTITLVKMNPLRLSLTVPQHAIGSVQPGQKVQFYVDSFPDHTFEAVIHYVTPVVASDTRSMVVEAVASNPDDVLRPGLFATAELSLPGKQFGVFAPLKAVQRAGDVAKVFVVRDGVTHEQVVSLGAVDDKKAEILTGLTGKETIVVHPELVHDGDAVH
jgi:RND family efflux transporter MFP subunit